MKKAISTFIAVSAFGFISIAGMPAFAQTAATSSLTQPAVTFPIAALGNCADAAACHAYCNIAANMQACTSYAENNGLVTSSQAKTADNFAKLLASGNGPGGCSSPDSCDAYCSSVSHLKACLSFAQANGITDDRIQQGQKLESYLQSGGQMPGGCDSQDSCQSYCSDASHRGECLKFAEAAGMSQGGGPGSNGQVSPEAQQKFQALLQAGKTPGGCTTLIDCEIYCNDASHGSACSSFAQDVGMQPGPDIKGGPQTGPGGCNSDASCQAYCNDPSHAAECRQFSEQQGVPHNTPSQTGPGGCTSDATCQAYCNDPSHAAECQQFGKQSGNFIQGTSTGYGSPTGGCSGPNEYWDGKECASSGPVQHGGSGSGDGTPPPCPAGQVCNTDLQQGPQSGPANLVSIFNLFVQSVMRLIGG